MLGPANSSGAGDWECLGIGVGSWELTPNDSPIAIVRQCAFCSLHPTWPSRSRPPVPAIAPSFPIASSGISTTSSRTGTTGRPRTRRLEQGIERYAALKGTLSQGPERLLEAFKLSEDLGQLAYRVWYFPSLRYDEDQRDNTINARRQQVQLLFARWKQAESWFNPELLSIPLETVRGWMASVEALRLYQFAIEDLYRQQEHVLDEAGRAADVAGEPAGVGAERCLLGAVDGRRQVSRR